MKEQILTSRLTQDERETHFYIEGQKVICDSTDPKYFNKCLRQGWTPIAKTVYPEAFADIDITAKTNEVTQMFFGKDLAEAIFACPSSFGGYQKLDTAAFFG